MDYDLIPAEQESRLTIVRNDRGEVIRANAAQPLIDWMVEAYIIEEFHHFVAIDFFERKWRHEMGAQPKSVSLDRIDGIAADGGNIYTTIIMKMPSNHLDILFVIEGLTATDQAKAGSRQMRPQIIDALETLASVTESVINACAPAENVVNHQSA